MAISEGERIFLTKLNKMWDEGVNYREKQSKGWKDAIEVMKGNTWPDRRPKYKVNAVMNFLAQVVERKAAILTDSKPTMNVLARKEGLDNVASILLKVIQSILEGLNFEQRLTEFVMLEEYFGIAYTNTCWDKALDHGRGDIDLVILDPRTCVIDPFVSRAYNLNNGEYFGYETVRPTDFLKDKYHERADDIKADFGTDLRVKEDSVIGKIRTFISGKSATEVPSSVIPRSVVRSMWVRDRLTKKDAKLVYPNWRQVTIAGGCIVADGTNPYLDGNLSVDGMEWGFNVDSAYGTNEVSLLENPQIMFNKLLAVVLENATLTGNNIWIGDQDALTEEGWKRLTNEPGSYVKKRPGKELRREPPPQMPTYINNILTLLIQGIEKLSGVTEVTEGRKPGQVTSGVAIETLALMAQTTIRLRARQLEALIQRIGQKLISRIFQHYTEDRVFNLTGDGQKFVQFVLKRNEIREALIKAGSSPLTAFQDFQFKVVPSSSLAITKWQKGLVATQLYGMGIIDDEEVLQALEWANREEVIKRTKEKQASGKLPLPGKGGKLPKSMLRGGHKETGMQQPQIGK